MLATIQPIGIYHLERHMNTHLPKDDNAAVKSLGITPAMTPSTATSRVHQTTTTRKKHNCNYVDPLDEVCTHQTDRKNKLDKRMKAHIRKEEDDRAKGYSVITFALAELTNCQKLPEAPSTAAPSSNSPENQITTPTVPVPETASGEKRFKCGFVSEVGEACDYGNDRKREVEYHAASKHLPTEEQEKFLPSKNYKCQYCPRAYTEHLNLEKHLKDKHSDLLFPRFLRQTLTRKAGVKK